MSRLVASQANGRASSDLGPKIAGISSRKMPAKKFSILGKGFETNCPKQLELYVLAVTCTVQVEVVGWGGSTLLWC